jgi:hypothetical protein
MDIEIRDRQYTVHSYCLGNCHIAEIAAPISGELIARAISELSSAEAERDAIQKARHRLSRPRVRDFELMVGG